MINFIRLGFAVIVIVLALLLITKKKGDAGEPGSSLQKSETRTQGVKPLATNKPWDLPEPEAIDFAAHAAKTPERNYQIGDHVDVEPLDRDESPAVIREKLVRFPKRIIDLVKDLPEGQDLPRVTYPLFDGEEVEVQFVRHDKMDDRNGSLHGVIDDVEHGHVTIGYSDEAQAGTLRVNSDEVYSVFYNGNDEHRIVQVDVSKIPPCSHPEHNVQE